MSYSPDECHLKQYMENEPLLKFRQDNDFENWKTELKNKLTELLGDMPDKFPLSLLTEWEKEREKHKEIRFIFNSEKYAAVPCHLLIPKGVKKPCPVVICIQGHSSGMHISLGKEIYPGDKQDIEGERDFALQAVRQGYAALVIEQRCFGERKANHAADKSCLFTSLNALLSGRTMIGERVWDVCRAIDCLSFFNEIDTNKIGCMGNSGGGTVTYYAACIDDRIKIAMPSCSVCTYKASIGNVYHCSCNYIPKAAKYFEMAELAALITPRCLIVVTGIQDKIFPIEGVSESFENITEIYKKADSKDNCMLVIGEEGHRFYSKQGWEAFKKYADKLKW